MANSEFTLLLWTCFSLLQMIASPLMPAFPKVTLPHNRLGLEIHTWNMEKVREMTQKKKSK
jgi:hypothetical protein